jgi:SAM-dependent methyltransferase
MITYRRELLDRMLETNAATLRGTVLDIGGKRESQRGRFRATVNDGTRWLYFNIDTSTRPHALADAHSLPLAPRSVDAVVCCEVLEHVRDARVCCNEIFDALRPGGKFVFSVPFLYPVHADPHDFTRFTADGVRQLCAPFETVQVEPMGSWLGTIGLFLDLGARSLTGGLHRAVARKALRAFGRFLCRLDRRGMFPVRAFTTGWFCVATKGAAE